MNQDRLILGVITKHLTQEVDGKIGTRLITIAKKCSIKVKD